MSLAGVRSSFLGSLLCLLSFSGVAQTKLRVAVASSFLHSFRVIETGFEEENPDIDLEIISASSGVITNQILNNAPYDYFLAADSRYPKILLQSGKCEKAMTVVEGTLIFWSKLPLQESPSETLKQMNDRFTLAIANPVLAPYGKAAKEWLTSNNQFPIRGKLVQAENITQVNQYIFSGSVDAAITANSSRFAKEMSGRGNWSDIQSPAITHQGCIVMNSPQKGLARNFQTYLLASNAQMIFRKFGYLSPNPVD